MRAAMPPASGGKEGKDARHNLNKADSVFEKAGLNSPPQPSAVRSTTGPFWARNMSRAGKPRKLAQTGSPAPSTSTKSPKLALGHGNEKKTGFDESRWHSATLLLATLSCVCTRTLHYLLSCRRHHTLHAGLLQAPCCLQLACYQQIVPVILTQKHS